MAEEGASEESLPRIQSPSTEKIRMLSHQFGFDIKDEDISMYQANSKENFAGTKRVHSADSSGSSLVIKKSKHGSGDKIEAPDVKEPATDSKSKEPPDDIKPLLATLVYHHFYDTDALAGELEDPGSEFCLSLFGW